MQAKIMFVLDPVKAQSVVTIKCLDCGGVVRAFPMSTDLATVYDNLVIHRKDPYCLNSKRKKV